MGPLVVLAYSGGLDTSAIVPWLREHHGARVLCFAADVGQGIGELGDLVAKAKRSGATDCVIEDLREEFVRDFVFPSTAPDRPRPPPTALLTVVAGQVVHRYIGSA